MGTSDCPSEPVLVAFNFGELPEADLEAITQHLESCPRCETFLESLDGRTDSAIAALRYPGLARDLGRIHALAAPGSTAELPAVSGYEVLGLLGEGGMGVVYRARQVTLDRLVALKLLRGGSSKGLARFRAEALAVARLQHPHVVQIFEIGEHQGQPYLALELLEGGSLEAKLTGEAQAAHDAATLICVLARAIEYAHSRGIVHRDLKPSNVLLTAEGTAKIADFGLAKFLQATDGQTHEGDLVGTPRYMAPEQTRGTLEAVGPVADIYSLGVILYELLTGRAPLQAPTPAETLLLIRNQEPLAPSRLLPRLPRDLETICLTCLQKDPRRRYASAQDLADDLERFLAGKPIRARPVGLPEKALKWVVRNPLPALLLALLTISLIGGLAGVSWKWLEANANARQANDEKREAVFQTYRARIAAAVAALSVHDVADAARQLDAAPKELRDWEWRHLESRLDDSSAMIPMPARNAGVVGAPDRLQAWELTDSGLRVIYLENHREDKGKSIDLPVSSTSSVFSVVPTRSGLRILAKVGKTGFDLLDEAGRALCRLEMPGGQLAGPVALSPDGMRLACQLPDHVLRIFDARTGKQTAVAAGNPVYLWAFTFSPDGSKLAGAGDDNLARIWDAATGKLLAACRGHTSKVLGVAFRADGARLLTASFDGTVRQWDAATGREVEAPYDRHTSELAAAVYSPDGQWIASAGADRTIRVWQAAGRQDVAVLHGHTGAVTGLAFATGGRRLASLSHENPSWSATDHTVRIWEVDPHVPLPVLRGHTSYVYPVAFSSDGRWIASGGWDNTARLWDAATGELCATLPQPGIVLTLDFSPDGRSLVTASLGDDRLRIWDVPTMRLRKEIQGPGSAIRFLTISPDGARVAAHSNDAQNRPRFSVCDLSSGKRLFEGPGRPLAYSPDGRWLAVVPAEDENTAILMNAQTHETIARFQGHEKRVMSATFSPDSRRLASCSLDLTVRLWPLDRLPPSPAREDGVITVTECQVLRGHTDEVFAAAFHPDGTRLATAGRDRAIWLWDLARGEEVARLAGHTSYVWSLAWSPDGATLVSGSGDSTVRLWDTAPLKTRYEARREADALRPEAERLVEQLWRQKNDAAAVVDALRADEALTEPLRHAALRAVLRRAQPREAAPSHRP
jgi:eukaryotic-like serine/threonine-protein kinase